MKRETWISLAACCVVALVACSDARLQPRPPEPPPRVDNLLRVRGDYCVEPDRTVEFPVKVLFLIDQSASLQCTDPANRRNKAMEDAVRQVLGNRAAQVGVLGFSSWARQLAFTRDMGAVLGAVDPSGGLGPATDYQGSLASALRIVEQDIVATDPVERPRTRYVLVFVSDGVAEPRCKAGCEDSLEACLDGDDNDGDGLSDLSDPDCQGSGDNRTHPDNLYGICNTTQMVPDDVYVDFEGLCPAYNQPEQIRRRVQDLQELQDIYNIGGISLNSVFLFAPAAEVEAVCGNVSSAFGYDQEQARQLLRSMATTGNGVFRDVNLASAEQDEFLRFDFRSLSAPLWLSRITAWNEYARLGGDGVEPDTDVDGLPDSLETTLGTDPRLDDSDNEGGDRYGDLFEYRNRGQGFDPLDPGAPAVPCGDSESTDLDGDGVRDCEEAFLGSDPRHADSDGDGMLDWHELVLGLDPVRDDALEDPDFDTIANVDELLAGTDPRRADASLYRDEGVRHALDDVGLRNYQEDPDKSEDLRHCYEFDIQRIQLVETPLVPDRGLNRVLLHALEQPAQLAGARATARVACLEVFYRGAGGKDPPSGAIDLRQEVWTETLFGIQDDIDRLGECGWFGAEGFDRQRMLDYITTCLPEYVQIDRYAFDAEASAELIQRYVAKNAAVELERRSAKLFVKQEQFKPGRHCYRPWELDYLAELISRMLAQCSACGGEMDLDAGLPAECCAASASLAAQDGGAPAQTGEMSGADP